jgi:penicillin-binding protein A
MNRPVRRIAVAFMALFFLLLANVNYIQVFKSGDYNDNADNTRVLLDEYARKRGDILVGGTPVAYSKKTDDDLVYLRRYRQPQLYGHLTGYYSYIFGPSAIEAAQNPVLAGTDDRLFVRRIVDLVTNRQAQGGSVQLTIDPKAQQAAFDALGNNRGSVVAIKPSTGEILAMVSKPTYNPNKLSSHNGAEIRDEWDRLNEAESRPSENRATQRRYPPGSTFKLVTAAAALSTGDYDPDSRIPAPAELDLPLTTAQMRNWQDGLCGDDPITLTDALATSCNTAFAGLGMKVGADALREQAEKFGFGAAFLPELRGASSVFPEDPNEPQTAQSSIGQFDVSATPLQMAMVTAGIANGGRVMKPHIVARVNGPELQELEVTEPEVASQAVSPEVADQLKQMMVDVVESPIGTGGPVKIPGVSVGGKTGTAQTTPDRPPFAWFVALAPADNPAVAVAVVIEQATGIGRNEISGGRLAAPVARDVINAVIG